jgi:Putative restriction endonuclease
MPEPQPDWPRTLEEFRVWHERRPDVWEFIDGALRLVTPGSKAHTLVKSNVHAVFAQALRGTGCRALVEGATVEVHGSSLIPDIVVPRFLDATRRRTGHHRRDSLALQ